MWLVRSRPFLRGVGQENNKKTPCKAFVEGSGTKQRNIPQTNEIICRNERTRTLKNPTSKGELTREDGLIELLRHIDCQDA